LPVSRLGPGTLGLELDFGAAVDKFRLREAPAASPVSVVGDLGRFGDTGGAIDRQSDFQHDAKKQQPRFASRGWPSISLQ